MRLLGFDLGGSKLLASVLDEDGKVLDLRRRPTGRHYAPEQALADMQALANELGSVHGPFQAAGVGVPGLVDAARGRVYSSVMLDGWQDVPLGDWLEAKLRIPCAIENDVNAAAVAELAARRDETPVAMLFVAVGTGIGGALAFHGKLWRGVSGIAGEIGNTSIDWGGELCWCGRRGCLNTVAAGSQIEAQAGIPAGSLRELVQAGDARTHERLSRAILGLGVGLGNVLNLLNPDLIVLGGGVAALGETFIERVAAEARSQAFAEARTCRFEAARAGYHATAVGAGLLGREKTSIRERT